MTSLDDRVSAVQRRISQARDAQAKAEHEHARAAELLQEIVSQLGRDFGVSSAAEGRELLATLEAEAEAESQRISKLLDEAEGGQQA